MGFDRRRSGAGLSVLWVKTFHILFVVSWFAGLFYLPRIYVNLAQTTDAGTRAVLLGMAQRLYRFMTPLGVLALIMGLWLWLIYGIGQGQGWMHAKLLFVVLLIADHLACRHYLRAFESDTCAHSHRFFRIFNEIPVVLLLLILILVVTKPF
ncbi:MAG: CopD family protein [Castellaniella sp.]|uniref:CopD family protein n=1 Tax=Castellaniella sp. TaxID=1955812 RepID=UPI0011F58225|nr:CopD family protein [Castellaniella sp.]TAN30292.1 MAG: CopD family protein [Castellaniella sp.]